MESFSSYALCSQGDGSRLKDSSMSQGTSAMLLSPTKGREGSSRSVKMFLVLSLEHVCENQLWSCPHDSQCRTETLISLLRNLKLELKSRKEFYFPASPHLFLLPFDNYKVLLQKKCPKKIYRQLLRNYKKRISQCISGKLKYLHMNQILFSSTHTQVPLEQCKYALRPNLATEILLENGN